jgi:hypothetical protein
MNFTLFFADVFADVFSESDIATSNIATSNIVTSHASHDIVTSDIATKKKGKGLLCAVFFLLLVKEIVSIQT